MTFYTGTLYLDAAGCECEAVYELDDVWSQGEPTVSSVSLISWKFGDFWQERDTALMLLGAGEVERQEGEAVEAWLDTAIRDMADNRADSRSWAAE